MEPEKNWPEDTLAAVVAANDLHVAPYREDSQTPGTPTWIWSVAVNGALYVRAYHGKRSCWYQAACRENAGEIRANGQTHAVTFTPVADGALNARIDAAYESKYRGSRYLAPMIAAGPRAATVRIDPR